MATDVAHQQLQMQLATCRDEVIRLNMLVEPPLRSSVVSETVDGQSEIPLPNPHDVRAMLGYYEKLQKRYNDDKIHLENDLLNRDQTILSLRFELEANDVTVSRLNRRLLEDESVILTLKQMVPGSSSVIPSVGVKSDGKAVSKRMEELENTMESMRVVIERLQHENDLLKKSTVSNAQVMEYKNVIKNLKSDKEALNGQVTELSNKCSELSNLTDQVRRLTVNLDALTKKNAKLEKDNAKLMKDLARSSQDQVEEYAKRIIDLENENNRLKEGHVDPNPELIKKIRDLEGEVTGLKIKVATTAKPGTSTTKAHAPDSDKIKKQNQQLMEKVKDLSASNEELLEMVKQLQDVGQGQDELINKIKQLELDNSTLVAKLQTAITQPSTMSDVESLQRSFEDEKRKWIWEKDALLRERAALVSAREELLNRTKQLTYAPVCTQ